MRRLPFVLLATLVVLTASCRKKNDLTANINAQNKVAVKPIRLFYETPQMLLGSEVRNIGVPENPAGAVPVVARELLKGPGAGQLTRLLPADAVVRGAYLLPDGTAIVDLGGPTLAAGWGTGSHQELMAAYSITTTLSSNFPEVRRTRLLINGAPAETLGGHISLRRSLVPRNDLLAR